MRVFGGGVAAKMGSVLSGGTTFSFWFVLSVELGVEIGFDLEVED